MTHRSIAGPALLLALFAAAGTFAADVQMTIDDALKVAQAAQRV